MIVEAATTMGARVTATVRTADERIHNVSWTLPGNPDSDAADALLAATLLPAMARGEALHLEGPVSSRLLKSVPTIQDVFVSWSRRSELMKAVPPVFHRVPVDAVERTVPLGPQTNDVASFFSGGVDSFYTVVKHREELTTLVFVHGFDVPFEDTAQRERVADGVRHAAQDLGLRLLEVETDVRQFSDRYVTWLDSHGAVLASVALLLGRWFRRIYVPATQTYSTLTPLGSHPLVDPLWSTERVEIVHDGCEATRLDKLRAIDASPAARAWLRVCPRNQSGTYNCGRCEKCLRTMAGLRVLGLHGRFSSLPDVTGRRFLRRVARAKVPGNRTTWEVYMRAAEQGNQRPLARAIKAAYARRRVRVRVLLIVEPFRARLRERRASRASRT